MRTRRAIETRPICPHLSVQQLPEHLQVSFLCCHQQWRPRRGGAKTGENHGEISGDLENIRIFILKYIGNPCGNVEYTGNYGKYRKTTYIYIYSHMFTVQGLMIWGNAVSTEKKESTSEIHGGTSPILGAYKKMGPPNDS